MSNVISAYQYYLGRYPEDVGAVDYHSGRSGGDLAELRKSLTTAPEYSESLFKVPQPKPGTFFFPRANAPKVCVLGNCQGPNIALALAAISKAPISVCGLEIMDFQASAEWMIELIKDADYVVACKTYDPKFEPISPEVIRDTYRKQVFEYSPVHFTGLHPDILILGAFRDRILSPVGDYNSRIVLSAFVSGLSQAECLDAFCAEIYDRADYFTEFQRSNETMAKREEALDDDGLRFREWFVEQIKDVPLLYSVNHPNSRVFYEIAHRILDKIGLSYRPIMPEMVTNTLSSQVIWPVEREFSEAHDLAYESTPLYWRGNVPLDREEFVWRSYLAYDALGSDRLAEVMGPRVIRFD